MSYKPISTAFQILNTNLDSVDFRYFFLLKQLQEVYKASANSASKKCHIFIELSRCRFYMKILLSGVITKIQNTRKTAKGARPGIAPQEAWLWGVQGRKNSSSRFCWATWWGWRLSRNKTKVNEQSKTNSNIYFRDRRLIHELKYPRSYSSLQIY